MKLRSFELAWIDDSLDSQGQNRLSVIESLLNVLCKLSLDSKGDERENESTNGLFGKRTRHSVSVVIPT